jgi:hypothetical protein
MGPSRPEPSSPALEQKALDQRQQHPAWRSGEVERNGERRCQTYREQSEKHQGDIDRHQHDGHAEYLQQKRKSPAEIRGPQAENCFSDQVQGARCRRSEAENNHRLHVPFQERLDIARNAVVKERNRFR